MGSRLSGNFQKRPDARPRTEDFACLNINHWHRDGKLNNQEHFWTISADLLLRIEGDLESLTVSAHQCSRIKLKQHLSVDRIESRPGLHRYFLICPKLNCRKRVGSLYFQQGFYCRECLGLRYPSQSRSRLQREFAEYVRLEQKLPMLEGYAVCPKGMHQSTFLPLARRAELLYRRTHEPIDRANKRVSELDNMSTQELQAEVQRLRNRRKRSIVRNYG